jgi:hypothetical protein
MFAPSAGRLICVFRRRTEIATEEPAPQNDKPVGKGRPTPKRRDAERRNRSPITAPRTRKEAYRQTRERQTEQRAKARDGMARGDERYMLKRDQGPVKKLARDYVDSRRTFGEFFMYVMIVFLLASFAAPLAVRAYLQTFGLPVMLVVIIAESFFITRQIKKLARERFPGESLQGIGFYSVSRAMQIRRLRMPKPHLKPGQQSEV